jgi:hypothetical protein
MKLPRSFNVFGFAPRWWNNPNTPRWSMTTATRLVRCCCGSSWQATTSEPPTSGGEYDYDRFVFPVAVGTKSIADGAKRQSSQ